MLEKIGYSESLSFPRFEGYLAVEIIRLLRGGVVPIYQETPPVIPAARPETKLITSDDEEGWGNKGTQKPDSTLLPPSDNLSYSQRFKLNHPKSIHPALKPSDQIIKNL